MVVTDFQAAESLKPKGHKPNRQTLVPSSGPYEGFRRTNVAGVLSFMASVKLKDLSGALNRRFEASAASFQPWTQSRSLKRWSSHEDMDITYHIQIICNCCNS